MAENVKMFDIQTPTIVRLKDEDRYELVNGHRRRMACELSRLETMPCTVRALNRDEAIIAMVDEGHLDNKTIISVKQEYKPAQAKHFNLPREKIQCFFPVETPAQRIEETIIKALEL